MSMLLFDRRRKQRAIDDVRAKLVRLYVHLGLIVSLFAALLYYISEGQ